MSGERAVAGRVILVGVLADQGLRAALGLDAGRPVRVPGALSGGDRAGIEAGIEAEGWPVYDPSAPGWIEGIEVARSPALDRYTDIMGLTALPSSAGPLLGARAAGDRDAATQARAGCADDEQSGIASDAGQGAARASAVRQTANSDAMAGGSTVTHSPPSEPVSSQPSDRDLPAAPQPTLAAAIAAALIAQPAAVDAAALRQRLPMIGVWAASQLRALTDAGRDPAGPIVSDTGSPQETLPETSGEIDPETLRDTRSAPPPNPAPHAALPTAADTQTPPPNPPHSVTPNPPPSRIRILSRREPYAHFFSVEELRLTHRLHDGGWSAPLERAVFVSGDAVVVLPWCCRGTRCATGCW